MLIYLTFKEQIDANNLTRIGFNNATEKETQRKDRIKNIILWNLQKRIKPNALKIKTEIQDYIPHVANISGMPFADHVDFNTDIFDANSLNDYFEIFNKDYEDLNHLCNFYKRVEFIYRNRRNKSGLLQCSCPPVVLIT